MVENPEKELRFTRVRQARVFFIVGVLLLVAAVTGTVGSLLPGRWGAPELQAHWWVLIPLLTLCLLSLKLALHCIKHAYLIFTPLGVEIFPFRNPDKNLRVIYWSEIDSLELKDENLFIHKNKEKTAGVVISLKPIHKAGLPLISRIVEKRGQ